MSRTTLFYKYLIKHRVTLEGWSNILGVVLVEFSYIYSLTSLSTCHHNYSSYLN